MTTISASSREGFPDRIRYRPELSQIPAALIIPAFMTVSFVLSGSMP